MFSKFQLKNRPLLGVCLDGDQIYFAEMQTGKNGYRFKTGSESIPAEAVDEGWPNHQSLLERALRDLCQKHSWQRKRMVASLAAKQIVLRHLTLPLMPDQELKKAVAWEAEKYLPRSRQDYSFDYQVLRRDKGEGRMVEVLLAALPRELARQYWSVFQKAGCRLEVIDIVPLALERFLRYGEKVDLKEKPLLLLHLGNDCSTVAVIQKGKLSFTRILSFGAKTSGPQSLAGLIAEIERSLHYFRLEYRSLPPDRAIISGPLRNWPSKTLEYLEQRLSLTIEISMPGQAFMVDGVSGPEHAVAMGLALRGGWN
ncbi:MAG: type IV pilus biogenesis protein PilM [Bacillota bacterium]|jgi:type IV pilus assembly protein PilM